MVFNATFNSISVISWRSILLVEETEYLGETHRKSTDKLYHIMLYTSSWASGIRTHNISTNPAQDEVYKQFE